MKMQEILKALRKRYDHKDEIPDLNKAIDAIDTLIDIDCFYMTFESSMMKSFKLFMEEVRFELIEKDKK